MRAGRVAAFACAACVCFTAVAEEAPAEKLIAAGHWKRAQVLVEMRIREMPDDPLANYLLSQVRNAFGDRSTPQTLAEKAVMLDGRTAKYHRQYAEVLGVMAEHAGMLQQLLLARRFRKEIDTAIMLDPHDTQALRDLIEFYLLAPSIAGGDARKASETADRIAQIDPAEGYLAKARIAAFHKDAPQTEALLRQAAAVQPASYRARITLAQFYLDPGHTKLPEAEAPAKDALQLDGSRIDAYSVLAEVYAGLGNWDALDSTLAQSAKNVPDDSAPDYRAAVRLIEERREPSRAERYLRAYLMQPPEGNEPPRAEAHWKLGLALEQQGKQGAAIDEWRESVRLDQQSPAVRELKRLKGSQAAAR